MSKTYYDKLDSNLYFEKNTRQFIINELKREFNEYNLNLINLINIGANFDMIVDLICLSFLVSLRKADEHSDNFAYKLKLTSNAYKKEILENDELFIELKKDYTTLLKNLKEFLKTINLNDEISMNIFLTNMIKNGFLSISDKCIYKILEKERKLIDIADISGSRVMSGSYVCRHISSFLSDINNEIGYKSNTVSVKQIDKKDIYYKLLQKKKISNLKSYYQFCDHMVTKVDTNDGSFIIDPTNNLFYELSNEKSENFFAEFKYAYFLGFSFDEFCDLSSFLTVIDIMNFEYFNKPIYLDEIDLLKNSTKLKKKELDVRELAEVNNKSNYVFEQEQNNLFDFKKENLKLIKSISDKEKIISGY